MPAPAEEIGKLSLRYFHIVDAFLAMIAVGQDLQSPSMLPEFLLFILLGLFKPIQFRLEAPDGLVYLPHQGELILHVHLPFYWFSLINKKRKGVSDPSPRAWS